MTRTLGTLLAARATSLMGRDAERAALLDLVHEDTPLAAVVHGIAGVGKSALVDAFAADAREAGAQVVALDARAIEPTERGFLAALGDALVGAPFPTVGHATAALDHEGKRVVVCVDTYELLRSLDTWLRRTLLPALPDNVRVLLAGREPPLPAWLRDFGPLVRSLALGNLAPQDAEEVLRRDGADDQEAARIARLVHGHPLALRLASSSLIDRPGIRLEEAAMQPVVEELTEIYLRELDPATRRALDAASVVRRTTIPLLAAMLDDQPAADAFERLRRLPFAELGREGLVLHDTVRAVTSAVLRSADPARHRAHRAAAWAQLRRELREHGHRGPWHFTADMLFLIEDPSIREAMFPTASPQQSVEPAQPADWPAIDELAGEHESPAELEQVRVWWRLAPHTFVVARDRDGTVAGYAAICRPEDVPVVLFDRDPVASGWRRHLRAAGLPPGSKAIFVRHLLNREGWSVRSPAQAALFLEMTRAYFELRPALRRGYARAGIFEGVAGRCAWVFGYRDVPGAEGQVVDFGPASVDGWLAELGARELLEDVTPVLDTASRQLALDGDRVDLTRLEFDVLAHLRRHEGEAVEREALLRDVWGYDWTGGSNVVDVVVSALRRKLGSRAGALQTVRGVGYRLQPLV